MRYEDALPRATPPLGAVSGKAQDVLAAHDGSENEAARELLDDALGTARMRAGEPNLLPIEHEVADGISDRNHDTDLQVMRGR